MASSAPLREILLLNIYRFRSCKPNAKFKDKDFKAKVRMVRVVRGKFFSFYFKKYA